MVMEMRPTDIVQQKVEARRLAAEAARKAATIKMIADPDLWPLLSCLPMKHVGRKDQMGFPVLEVMFNPTVAQVKKLPPLTVCVVNMMDVMSWQTCERETFATVQDLIEELRRAVLALARALEIVMEYIHRETERKEEG